MRVEPLNGLEPPKLLWPHRHNAAGLLQKQPILLRQPSRPAPDLSFRRPCTPGPVAENSLVSCRHRFHCETFLRTPSPEISSGQDVLACHLTRESPGY